MIRPSKESRAKSRSRRISDDISALGWSAPVRAAYEASKRSGFHSALFSGKVRSAPPLESVLLGNADPLGTGARERTLDDAGRILAEGVRVFGRRSSTGVSAPWSQDPDTGKRWPHDKAWWRIDIRTDARLGDVKFVWEAARHRDLVVLARASRLDPAGPWLAALDRMLTSWCRENEPEKGVNWYSSLELALRAVAWTQVFALVGDRLAEQTRAAAAMQLAASARHLMVELPYTISSMKNNHMLGDALGLIVLSRIFPQHKHSARWARFGERLFAAQLHRHMRPDGSMIEDSVSYHRFVLEMLVVRTLLGGAPCAVTEALRGASLHLSRLGVFDGPLPQYGDWDEGRVLASSGDPLDLAGSAALGLALTGSTIPREWFERYDEIAWYAPPETPCGAPDTWRPQTVARSGCIAYLPVANWRVWFKVGSAPSHQHADLTSFWLQREGSWIVADPGTGTYNGPLDVRNGLRTSAAHPVVRVDDADQLQPHRAFRWLGTATGHLAPIARLGRQHILLGWHDAYERVAPGLRVARVLIVNNESVTVVDVLSPESAGRTWQMTVPLAPGVSFTGQSLTWTGGELPVTGLEKATEFQGSEHPWRGWHSPTYGTWVPSTWLSVGSASDHAVLQFGDAPGWQEQNGDLRVGDLILKLNWDDPSTVALTVTDGVHGGVTVIRT